MQVDFKDACTWSNLRPLGCPSSVLSVFFEKKTYSVFFIENSFFSRIKTSFEKKKFFFSNTKCATLCWLEAGCLQTVVMLFLPSVVLLNRK